MMPLQSSSHSSTPAKTLAKDRILDVELPYCDERPMPDADFQIRILVFLWTLLQDTFAERDLFIAMNMAVYFEPPPDPANFNLAQALDEDNENARVLAPDLFAVRGVSKDSRYSYKVWEEGRGPEFVVEIASPSTYRRDIGFKQRAYELRGVLEYLIYDPTDLGLLSPRLQFFVRREGRLIRAELNERGRYFSEVLNLEFIEVAEGMRFFELGSEDPILTPIEARELSETRERQERRARLAAERARREAEARAQSEREAKEAALSELAALKARLAKLETLDKDH